MGFTPVLNENDRAKRPIIEFDSNLSLFNHGTVSKKSVTLVDAVTTDVFTDMVNQTGYYVDGIQVTDGMRILFTADTDVLVRNKVYKVTFVTISGTQKISLQLDEESDTNPIEGESVYVEFGKNYQGKTLHYTEKAGPNKDEKKWIIGQNKTKVNQQPLFDIYDSEGNSFSNDTAYPSTNFAGSEIFSFKISDTATEDTVLGLKIKYNTINNVGDIVFESFIIRYVHPGSDSTQVNERAELPVLHVFRAKCRDGLRKVLEALGSLLRGNQDFLKNGRFLGPAGRRYRDNART